MHLAFSNFDENLFATVGKGHMYNCKITEKKVEREGKTGKVNYSSIAWS